MSPEIPKVIDFFEARADLKQKRFDDTIKKIESGIARLQNNIKTKREWIAAALELGNTEAAQSYEESIKKLDTLILRGESLLYETEQHHTKFLKQEIERSKKEIADEEKLYRACELEMELINFQCQTETPDSTNDIKAEIQAEIKKLQEELKRNEEE